jgi:hypothetical protein
VTARTDFTVEEWRVLRYGPPSAALLVAAAQRGGAIRESLALARAYAHQRLDPGNGRLLDEIVAWTPEVGHMRYRSLQALREQCTQNLRDAVELLRHRATPAELDEYRRFVFAVADRVARADRGGFPRRSGPRVSEAERAALDGIAEAVGAASASPPNGRPRVRGATVRA